MKTLLLGVGLLAIAVSVANKRSVKAFDAGLAALVGLYWIKDGLQEIWQNTLVWGNSTFADISVPLLILLIIAVTAFAGGLAGLWHLLREHKTHYPDT